jgi:hypothetical protein
MRRVQRPTLEPWHSNNITTCRSVISLDKTQSMACNILLW